MYGMVQSSIDLPWAISMARTCSKRFVETGDRRYLDYREQWMVIARRLWAAKYVGMVRLARVKNDPINSFLDRVWKRWWGSK